MSKELTKTSSAPASVSTTQKTDFNQLMGRLYNLDKCLLLDTSYSMEAPVEYQDGQPIRAIDNLRKLAEQFKQLRKFSFSSQVQEIGSWIPEPSGGTDLANAFRYLKQQGCKHVVLLTDGQPDDEESTLQEAIGLKVDVYYIGKGETPDFLLRLAKQCGGSVGHSELLTGNIQQIGQTIAGYLEGGSTDESKIYL